MSVPLSLRYEILKGLRDGRTLIVTNKRAPEFSVCLNLQKQGLVDGNMVVLDDGRPAIKFKWKGETNP